MACLDFNSKHSVHFLIPIFLPGPGLPEHVPEVHVERVGVNDDRKECVRHASIRRDDDGDGRDVEHGVTVGDRGKG